MKRPYLTREVGSPVDRVSTFRRREEAQDDDGNRPVHRDRTGLTEASFMRSTVEPAAPGRSVQQHRLRRWLQVSSQPGSPCRTVVRIARGTSAEDRRDTREGNQTSLLHSRDPFCNENQARKLHSYIRYQAQGRRSGSVASIPPPDASFWHFPCCSGTDRLLG